MAALPTSNLSLKDDIAVVLSETATLDTCCSSSSVVAEGLDPLYCTGEIPADRLANLKADEVHSYFKGYDPNVSTATLSYTFSVGLSDPFDRVYDVDLDYTNSTGAPITSRIYFTFSNEGSVPAGQSDRTQVSIDDLNAVPKTLVLEIGDTVGSFAITIPTGSGTFDYRYTYVNDNWDFPRPSTDLRVVCNGGFGIDITSSSTHTPTIEGVTTTFITATSLISSTGNDTFDLNNLGSNISIDNESGEMIHTKLTRNAATYTALNGYKDVQTIETYDTALLDSGLRYVAAEVVVEVGSDSNDLTDVFTHGDSDIKTIPTVSDYDSLGYYYRYTLLNSYTTSGSSSFSWDLNPHLYCSFTEVTHSATINSRTGGNHILTMKDLDRPSGNPTDGVIVPRLYITPNNNTLASTDVFSFKMVINCPTGGNVFLRLVTNDNLAETYTDQDEYSGAITTDVKFSLVTDIDNTDAATSILGGAIAESIYYFDFTQSDQYIVVTNVSNVATSSDFFYQFDQDGNI
jgi:hypothetical protein